MKRRIRPQKKTAWLKEQCQQYAGIYTRRTVRPGAFAVPGAWAYTTVRGGTT